jgi:photosystem II stability/assembly factor-like uncharacterized protein
MRFSIRSSTCLIASLLVLVAITAEAGQDRWTPIGVGVGLVQSLAVDPDGALYAAVGIAGIYKSTDEAQTWQWRGARTVNLDSWTSVIVAPDDPQRLYATTRPTQVSSGGVFTSADGGLHWQELFRTRLGFTGVAVSPNGTLLVATPDSEVFRSTDGGATWSPVLAMGFQNDPPPGVAIDPLAPETAYAWGLEGLWRSLDNGATWAKIGTFPDGQPVNGVSALVFPGARPGFLYALLRSRLYRSEDGGLTWSGGALLLGGYAALAVDPADPGTVYAAGSKVFVSHDGGDTATELPQPLGLPFPLLSAIVVSPAAPRTLYLSVDRLGVAVSSDAGEHWTLSEQRGLSANPSSFFNTGLFAASSGRLYHDAWRSGALFRSLDRGATWSPLAPLPSTLLYDFTEEAGAPDHLWATTGELFHSTDGGASWNPASPSVFAYTVASPSPGVVLAAGGCGLLRSVDSGRTWSVALSCTLGAGSEQITRRIVRLGTPHNWPGAVWAEVESTDGFLILFSQNSGRTWRILAKGVASFQRSHSVAASRGVIYLNRGPALQRSRDGGATWQTLPVGGRALSVAVDAADPDIVYIATRFRGVLRSTDGEATWVPVNAGLARLGRLWVVDMITDPKRSSVAYAFPIKGGVFQARFTD